MADDELLVKICAEWSGVIAVGGGEVAGAGVEAARGEAGGWELEEGLVLAEGEGVGVGGDIGDEGVAGGGGVGGEGEDGFDFGVLGEGFGGVKSDCGTGGVEFVRTLLELGESFGDGVGVAEEEIGGVDEDGAGVSAGCGVFGGYGEAGEDGLGEGLVDGEEFGGGFGRAAEGLVGLDEEDFGACALEVDDAAFGDLAAVEAEIVGAGAVGERVGVEEVVRGGGEFEVEMTSFGVPIQGDEAGEVGHAGGLGGDGGGRFRFLLEIRGLRLQGEAEEEEEEEGGAHVLL